MSLITIRPFSGMAPVVNPQALPPELAQNAVNAKLIYGDLRPWADSTSIVTPTKTGTKQTIYRFGENHADESEWWFSWTTDVDIVRAPMADDTTERTYFVGDGQPKVTNATLALTGGTNYPVTSYNLGVPAPATAPTLTVNAIDLTGAVATISETQISNMVVGDVLRLEIDALDPVDITLTGDAQSKVTTTTLQSQIDAVSGVSAAIESTSVKVTTDSSTVDSKISIKIKSGEVKSYAEADVTYTDLVATVNGSSSPESGATHTFYAADIADITPTQKLSITVNDNPPVLVTVNAGTSTFPAAVTAESLRLALSQASGLNVTVNAGVSPTVTATTALTGAATSLRIQNVNPGVTPAFSSLASASNASKDSTAVSVAYVITYVSSFDEESAPSVPTEVVDVKYALNSVTLTSIPTGISGPYNLTKKRIYRSNSGSASTQYQFVAEIPIAQDQYVDTTASEDLGEVVPTWGWIEPPTDMSGMRLMANGFAIGFSGNTIYMSEPYALYAYPPKYNMSVESPIVGIGVFGQSAFVGTKGFPYILSGTDPSTVSMIKLESKQACVSKRSIVQMLGGVVYASPDGLFMVNGSGISPVTSGILSRDDWQAYKPESIHAYELDNRYFAFYDNGVEQGCLIFNLNGGSSTMSKLDMYATAGYNDKHRDALYLCVDGEIVRFDSAETVMTYTWKSKIFRAPKYMNVGVGRVDADAYPVNFNLYVDGALTAQITAEDQKAFKLPSGYKGLFFEVEIVGDKKVNAVFFGETMADMKA